MTMHVPALHAPPISHETDIDAATMAAERRRQAIETMTTVLVVVVTISLISVVGVALELG